MADRRLDIFTTSDVKSLELLHKYFDQSWGPGGMGNSLEVVGAGIAENPVAVSWGKGRLDIL